MILRYTCMLLRLALDGGYINDILPNRLGNQCLKNNVCPHLPKIKYEYK